MKELRSPLCWLVAHAGVTPRAPDVTVPPETAKMMKRLTAYSLRLKQEISAPLCVVDGAMILGPVSTGTELEVEMHPCMEGEPLGGFHTHLRVENMPSMSLPSAEDMLRAQYAMIERTSKGFMAIGSEEGVVIYTPRRRMTREEETDLKLMYLESPSEDDPPEVVREHLDRLRDMAERLFESSPLRADELWPRRGELRWAGLRSPLCWVGGKSKLVGELMRRMPAHRVYVEPFAGAAWLFFAKDPVEVNVINDIDGRLMEFYRYLKTANRLGCDMSPSMEKWRRLRDRYNLGEKLAPCDYIYVLKHSYGCQPKGPTPSPSHMKRCETLANPSECKVSHLKRNFNRYRDLLSKAILLNKDYLDVIRRYDSKDTFFYLDPPYHGIGCLYVSCDVSPEQMARAVHGLKGKFLLSYNDHPDVRRAFRGYKIEKVQHIYEMPRSSTGSTKQVTELLIRNY